MPVLTCPEPQSRQGVMAQHFAGLRKGLFFLACCFFTYAVHLEKVQRVSFCLRNGGPRTELGVLP